MKSTRWISQTKQIGKSAAAALLLLLLLILFYPFKLTIVPEWNLKVADEAGATVRDVNVTEHWQHFLLESSSQEEVRRVDEDGQVSFPARSIRASVVRRVWATIGRINRAGWNARRTPAASIVVWGNKSYATTVAVYNPAELPQSSIIVPAIR